MQTSRPTADEGSAKYGGKSSLFFKQVTSTAGGCADKKAKGKGMC